MPADNENHRNLSHHGIKEAEGHAAHVDASAGTDMAPGITGAPLDPDPHSRGFKMPVGVAPSAARPMNDMGPGLLPANGCLNPDPHPYNPASQVKQANTYARVHKR